MKVYGFTADNVVCCCLSYGERDETIVDEIKSYGGPLPNVRYWEKDVPDDLITQTAYDYLEANNEVP